MEKNMADMDNDLISQLLKKIDDQFRFTRIVTVLCCLAIIGCLSYAISSLIYAMPDLVIAKIMSNMETLHTEWQTIEKVPTAKK
jgi:hypothetical protein